MNLVKDICFWLAVLVVLIGIVYGTYKIDEALNNRAMSAGHLMELLEYPELKDERKRWLEDKVFTWREYQEFSILKEQVKRERVLKELGLDE